MDQLYGIPFSNENLQKSIYQFQETFELLLKFLDDSLNSTTTKTLWAIIILKQILSYFSVIKTLQLAQYEGKISKWTMDKLIIKLEQEIQWINQLANSSHPSAFNISRENISKKASVKLQNKFQLWNYGTHNPYKTFSPEKFHWILLELAISYHQKSLNQKKEIVQKKSPRKLRLILWYSDPKTIMLNSRAYSHFLKHMNYISFLTKTPSFCLLPIGKQFLSRDTDRK